MKYVFSNLTITEDTLNTHTHLCFLTLGLCRSLLRRLPCLLRGPQTSQGALADSHHPGPAPPSLRLILQKWRRHSAHGHSSPGVRGLLGQQPPANDACKYLGSLAPSKGQFCSCLAAFPIRSSSSFHRGSGLNREDLTAPLALPYSSSSTSLRVFSTLSQIKSWN